MIVNTKLSQLIEKEVAAFEEKPKLTLEQLIDLGYEIDGEALKGNLVQGDGGAGPEFFVFKMRRENVGKEASFSYMKIGDAAGGIIIDRRYSELRRLA